MIQVETNLEKFTGTNASVYSLHLPIPNKVAREFINGEERRVLTHLSDGSQLRSGLMPFSKYWYILINQEVKKRMDWEVGQKIIISLEKDRSEYGMEMPVEFQHMLEQDPLLSEYFHKLTPGKQRNLLYLIDKPKSQESRLNKALAISDHLLATGGNLNFKLLNEVIKQYNQNLKLKN